MRHSNIPHAVPRAPLPFPLPPAPALPPLPLTCSLLTTCHVPSCAVPLHSRWPGVCRVPAIGEMQDRPCWPAPSPHARTCLAARRSSHSPCLASRACRPHCLRLLTCPLISSDQSCALPCPLASRLAFFPYLTLSHLLSHSYQYRHTYSCGHDVWESDRCALPQHLSRFRRSQRCSCKLRHSGQASDLRFQHSVVPVSSDRNTITPALISY